jgi:hypothetical protein
MARGKTVSCQSPLKKGRRKELKRKTTKLRQEQHEAEELAAVVAARQLLERLERPLQRQRKLLRRRHPPRHRQREAERSRRTRKTMRTRTATLS